MNLFKKAAKFFGKILMSSKALRSVGRRLISSLKFLDPEIRYKLRGMVEAVSPEETLMGESEFLGCRFYYPNKSIVGMRTAELGFWDDFSLLFYVFLANARAIVEIGANIGMDTLFMAKNADKNCKIIVIEPCDKYRNLLEKNIRENKLNNVFVYDYFISSGSRSEVKLYINSSSASATKNGSRFFPSTGSQSCRSITLDDFLREKYPEIPINFIKLDTDGWDQKVIESGLAVIKRDKPFLLIEFSDYQLRNAGNSNASLARLLDGLGYNEFFILSKSSSAIRVIGHENLIRAMDPFSSFDVFALPFTKNNHISHET